MESLNESRTSTTPILARFPDVTVELTPVRGQRASQAAAGFVEYRFDPPQTARADADPSQPAAVRRLPRRPPAILPDSNLFETPSASLYERLAPVLRFSTVFVLFAAAGTFALSVVRQADSTTSPSQEPPPPAPIQQSLEPAPDSPRTAAGPSIGDSSAIGPLGVAASPGDLPVAGRFDSPAQASKSSPSAFAEPPLPRVRTSEANDSGDAAAAPPAIARLSGHLIEAPSRQARHDDNQSSIH